VLSFLTPAFFAGLLAVAIPILVHLRMRERKTSLPFPSLMFVRKVPHRSSRRRTLQNLLLFAMRSLALVLLCLAFARPFIPAEAGGGVVSGPKGLVVALDVSASMGYEGVFPKALAAAEQAIKEVSASDAVGVVLFSDRAQGVVPPSTDHTKALAALREARPGAGATRFAPALRLAGDWLGALKVDRREIVLITDGQTKALLGAADVALPPATTVSTRSVAPVAADNTAVTDVSIEAVREGDRSFAIVTARLIHQGPKGRPGLVTLEVAGRLIEEKAVVLPETGALSVTFARAPLPDGISKGRVLLAADSLGVDDTLHFVLGAAGDIPVLLIDSMPYVARALEIGDQPGFDVRQRATLIPSDLAGRAIVILGEMGSGGLGPAATTALVRFVKEGGGLLATGSVAGLRGEARDLLPGTWGENISRLTGGGASIGFVDLDHPALLAFKQARGSDFSRARFLQYRRFTASEWVEGARTKALARFDDGREALIEFTAAKGRVIAFTSPLDGLMSDLPVQPLFLPLIHELVRYVSAHEEAPVLHRVGEAVTLADRAAINPRAPLSVLSPAGRVEKRSEGSTGVELTQVGFYEAELASGARKVFAANVDPAESDLSVLDPDELEAALRSTGKATAPLPAAGPAEAGAGQGFWRLGLLGVVLLLVAETVLGNAKGQKAAS